MVNLDKSFDWKLYTFSPLTGFEQISETFRLCEPLKSSSDYEHFLRWIRNAFVVTTMIDYPFSRGNFPAFPVRVNFESFCFLYWWMCRKSWPFFNYYYFFFLLHLYFLLHFLLYFYTLLIYYFLELVLFYYLYFLLHFSFYYIYIFITYFPLASRYKMDTKNCWFTKHLNI